MYRIYRRFLTVAMIVAILATIIPTAAFASTGVQQYASKVLYAFDQADFEPSIWGGNVDDVLRASADEYPNTTVLGLTGGSVVWPDKYYVPEKSGYDEHKSLLYVTSHNGDNQVKNITYKVESSNIYGFKELDISFTGYAEGAGFIAIQGSATAPEGEYGTEGYFSNFTDLRRIIDSTPENRDRGRDSTTKDYYNFGETIELTDTVAGLKEYYINISYQSANLIETAITDVSFTELVPVDYSDTEKYEEITIANGDVSSLGNQNFLWTNNEFIQNIPSWLGFSTGNYEYGTVVFNGHPFFATVADGAYGYSFVSDPGEGFSSITYKIIAPAGKTLKSLTFDYDGNCEIPEGTPKMTSNSITTYVGESPTQLGVAKRLASYTDSQGDIVKNLKTDLDAFTVEVNGEKEIWVKLMIAGGALDGYKLPYNYINKMKITGIVETNKVDQGPEITKEGYATKVLYTLDTSNIAGTTSNVWGDHSGIIKASADGNTNVEVLGVSSDIQVFRTDLGDGSKLNSAFGASDTVAQLICNTGTRNITYKITSTNPEGFEELDISYVAIIGEGAAENSEIAIQGSAAAPTGDFGSGTYYKDFAQIRKINDNKPGEANIYPYQPKNYHDYGETLVLTDAVKGLKEYYINFSITSEFYGSAAISEISFAEKIKADFSDETRFSKVELTNMNYESETDRNWIWNQWITNADNKYDLAAKILTPNEYCEMTEIKKYLQFAGNDSGENWLGYISSLDTKTYTCSSGGMVIKLTAPEGKVFKGLEVDLSGRNTIDACLGPKMGTSITVGVGDTYESYNVPGVGGFTTGLGVAKRWYSCTDGNGVVSRNTGALAPFTVIGNDKNVMYIEIAMGGGMDGLNRITGMKLTGIFAEESIIDDVKFSGNGAFPTGGELDVVFYTGSPKPGETMPDSITLLVGVYEVLSDGSYRLETVKSETISNPSENANYRVELNGLPQDSNNYIAKAFVWSDLSVMSPLSNVYVLGK